MAFSRRSTEYVFGMILKVRVFSIVAHLRFLAIQQAKVRYAQLKAEAKEKAAAATDAAARAALWSFFGLLVGILVSVFAGKMGVQHRLKHRRNTY